MPFSSLLKLIPTSGDDSGDDLGGYDVMCALKHLPEPSVADQPHDRPSHTRPYIRSMTFYVNNAVVATLQWGGNIAQDPIMGIHLSTLKQHDEVSIIWKDSETNQGTAKVIVG